MRSSILIIFCCLTAQFAESSAIQIDEVASELNHPWTIAIINETQLLLTERSGQLLIVDITTGSKVSVKGLPEVYFAGQGGLLDVLVDRNFVDNQTIYLSYADGDADANHLHLIKAQLRNNALHDIQTLFRVSPDKSTPQHYSGRILQLADGTLLLSSGDGFDYREAAQKLDNHLGKIVRINNDGSIPTDNPFVNHPDARPEIWSYGHRNVQGLVETPNGLVFQHEHGPQGGDELNLIQAGKNYGWPVITQGRDYTNARISPYTKYPGMEQPLIDWTPSIAPAGMVYYTGSLFPQWQNSLLVVSLKEHSLRQIKLADDNSIEFNKIILPQLDQRMRDIQQGNNGELYILTDGENGQLLRVKKRQ